MSQVTQECFTCSKTGSCSSTNIQNIISGYVCPLYAVVADPVVHARGLMMSQYGLVAAARALLGRPTEPDEERIEMSLDPPPPGTTYTSRKAQLESMSFHDVRNLGAMKYKDADKVPILDASATLHVDKRADSIEKVLQFELANNIIVPDGATQSQPTGAPQMAQQPFQPPMMPPPPGSQPTQMPTQMPMPQMPVPQQMVMPNAPFGMPPQPPQGAPMPMPPPPPPIASPQQAAQAAQEQPQAPQAGGKKKKGSAAAPPPPPPPPAPAQAPQMGMTVPQPPGGFQQSAPAWTPPMQQAPQFQVPQPPPIHQMPPPQFQVPQAAPAAQVDLSPVLAKIDAVGNAVNALGASDSNAQQQVLGILSEIRNLLFVQVAATHHIYTGQTHLAQSLVGKDVSDVNKFIAHMQQYFTPR